MFIALAGLHALNAVLQPLARRKRLRKLGATFGEEAVPLEFGTVIVTKEELASLRASGALDIIVAAMQRHKDLVDAGSIDAEAA